MTVAFSTSISRKLRSLTHSQSSVVLVIGLGFFPLGVSPLRGRLIHVLCSRTLLWLQACRTMWKLDYLKYTDVFVCSWMQSCNLYICVGVNIQMSSSHQIFSVIFRQHTHLHYQMSVSLNEIESLKKTVNTVAVRNLYILIICNLFNTLWLVCISGYMQNKYFVYSDCFS